MPRKPSKDRHRKKTASFRLRDDYLRLLAEVAEEERRTQTVILEMALEDLFRKRGKLSPPAGHKD